LNHFISFRLSLFDYFLLIFSLTFFTRFVKQLITFFLDISDVIFYILCHLIFNNKDKKKGNKKCH